MGKGVHPSTLIYKEGRKKESKKQVIKTKKAVLTMGSTIFVEHKHLGVSFEETVASFYEQFLTMQEPLGKEFEQVLHDNLWNLIVRT